MNSLPLVQITRLFFHARQGLIVTAKVDAQERTYIYPYGTRNTTKTEILNWIHSDIKRESGQEYLQYGHG